MIKIVGFFLKKYIYSRRREWLRYDSMFLILGIVISVAAVTVALALFEGYEATLKQTILDVNSHIYVFQPGHENLSEESVQELSDFLLSQPQVTVVAPIIMSSAMATKGTRIKGCLIRGVDWTRPELPTRYHGFVTRGTSHLEQKNDTVIGAKLASQLGVTVGDTISLISPLNSKVTPLGMSPTEFRCRIVGLYQSGMYEYDTKYVFLNISVAAAFTLHPEEYSMMEVKLTDDAVDSADFLAYRWSEEFGNQYQISSWIDFNGNLFALLNVEKWTVFIILSFLVLVAAFNVVSSVSTTILEKRREIGILKACGASNRLLKKIYLSKSLIVSVVSIILGLLVGVGIGSFLEAQHFFLLKGDVYFLDKINVAFPWQNLGITSVVALLIVYLTAQIPLRRISQLEVTAILRKE
ncbi:MAG: ABC transporter permease [Candidatus Cloacimonetes bacterium]|nr:ABC transporter permease [Candidatus Cloacimonadota bacterium]